MYDIDTSNVKKGIKFFLMFLFVGVFFLGILLAILIINIINYKMEAKMSSPLFYIYKVLKNRKKMQSNHNRKFRCPFSFCAKAYNHKNKMLAHLRTHVYILSFNPI